MLTPERLQILHQKYNDAKSTGLHRDVSLHHRALILIWLYVLFVCKAMTTKQFDSKKIKKFLPSYPFSPCHSSL